MIKYWEYSTKNELCKNTSSYWYRGRIFSHAEQGTSLFLARHEMYEKTTEKFVPSWERARTQNDYKYDLRFPSKWRHYSILNELIWLVNKLNLLWLQNSHEFVEICNKICSCQNRFRLLLLAGIQIWFWKTFK